MQRTYKVLGSVVLMSLAVGCSVDAGDVAPDSQPAGSQVEALSPYTQQVSDAAQSIVFTGPAGTQWVDVHFLINGSRSTNVRMEVQGSSFAIYPLPVVAGDVLSYSFTYSANGIAADTPTFQHTFPNPWVPPAFRSAVSGSGSAFKLSVISTRTLAWVDAHYQVNGGQQFNVRMQAVSGGFETPVTLHAGDRLSYSLTYSPTTYVLETAQTTYLVPGTAFTVDKTSDSATGNCVANGNSGGTCNLRAAFAAAEAAVQPVAINLSVPTTIDQGQIVINGSAPQYQVSVQGSSGVQTISNAGSSRLLWLSAGVLALQNVTINGFSGYDGGALVNQGQMSLIGVTLSNNTARCFGVGAMTAFASCNGGAVANYGTLTVGGGTLFVNNSVLAQAFTAAFTNATAGGGAIISSGTLLFNGPFTFAGNVAKAEASSGIHPSPGGASASSGGGAIVNLNGSLTVTGAAIGHCTFQGNSAAASASAPSPYGATTSTAGGAVSSSGGSVSFPAGACAFLDNHAALDPDLHVVP